MQTFDWETGIVSVVAQKFSIKKRSPLPNLSMTMARPLWKKFAKRWTSPGRHFTAMWSRKRLENLEKEEVVEDDRIWVSRPRCLEMLVKSDSSGVCILKITNHPQTIMNTGSEGFFWFREYGDFAKKGFYAWTKFGKSKGRFFYREKNLSLLQYAKKKHWRRLAVSEKWLW